MKKCFSKILMFFIITSLPLTVCGCSKNSKDFSKQENNYIPIEVEVAKNRDIFNSIVITGKVVGQNNIAITSKIPGKVINTSIKVGDNVKAGQVLAILDKKDIENKVKQAKIALDASNIPVEQGKDGIKQLEESIKCAKANYEISKANYDLSYEKYKIAKANLEKSEKLFRKGIITKSEYEQVQLMASDKNLNILKAQLEQAKKIVEQSENGINKGEMGVKQAQTAHIQAEEIYNEAKEVLEDTIIKAPTDGVITSLTAHEGEFISNIKPIISIVDLKNICVKLNVTEDLINKLNKGSSVNVYIPSLENEEIKGEIYSINPVADIRTNLYDVEVKISSDEGKIKPGMFVNVEFNTDYKKNTLAINSDSVIVEGNQKFVYLENKGKVIKKEITVGLDNGKYVEVKRGLNIGDRVVIKGQDYIEENSKIKVVATNNDEGEKE